VGNIDGTFNRVRRQKVSHMTGDASLAAAICPAIGLINESEPEFSRAILSKGIAGANERGWSQKPRSSAHSDDETCLKSATISLCFGAWNTYRLAMTQARDKLSLVIDFAPQNLILARHGWCIAGSHV
jgi:hypothetical protein